jgi:catalase
MGHDYCAGVREGAAPRPHSFDEEDKMPEPKPKPNRERPQVDETAKDHQLEDFRHDPEEQYLTTNQGVRVSHTDDSLKAGHRGPTLMEDFHLREKMMHFDHESIPERVVHARGSAAHGYFQPYESMAKYTRAKFLSDPSVKTPVFVRFSTVVGSRGSADTVRDVRGFATKFYTEEGVFDLVGNNMPVFFIQDGIKFPDLVHAIKPMPDNEMPQASAAHDTFWDFASLMPEITHMLMWVLSDRALPRSYRMMEGFGVHTFRWVNAQGEGRFIKWHWRPALGTASLVWDETQKIAGKDPDFNRRDLWEAIETGHYPEFELCVQMIEERQEHDFDFDILDATKIWPEPDVPLMTVGKMVLNRNPDNFFSETEQVAFHPGHVVPGIDFTNDPLLQGRLFSYLDTQLNRFGSANFHEIPINRPVCPVRNNQGAGFMRMTIGKGKANYFPNSLGGGYPKPASEAEGGYVHYTEKVDGRKIRERSESFTDHFSQATMFWHSITKPEQDRLVSAIHFELGKVASYEVRHRMIHQIFNKVDHELARRAAMGIGVPPPDTGEAKPVSKRAPEVGVEHQKVPGVKTLKVAILAAEGFDHAALVETKGALEAAGARPIIVSKFLGTLTGEGGEVQVDKSYVTTASVLFDAVYVPGGRHVEALTQQGDAVHYINEMFKHGKPIGASDEGVELLRAARLDGVRLADSGEVVESLGVVSVSGSASVTDRVKGAVGVSGSSGLSGFTERFLAAAAQHRHWGREQSEMIPA